MAADAADEADRGPPAACPTCGKPTVQTYRPFCSKRCADVDLQRWFTGRYAIPVVEDEDGPDDPPEDDAGQGGRGSL
jgi:uncharacterized protein